MWNLISIGMFRVSTCARTEKENGTLFFDCLY